MKLEVIASSAEDAAAAERAGADRLELCAALAEGGLTPSFGLIESVVRAVDIPVHVIVRPHSRTFVYSEEDLQVMLADIAHIRKAGAAGIVIGVLDERKRIDTAQLERLLDAAEGLNVTFHKAFDEIGDQVGAAEVLTRYPAVQRILTSGGPAPAPQAVLQLKRLVEKTEGTPLTILAGGGMTPEGLDTFLAETGVTEVHFGSAVRGGCSFSKPIDPAAIRRIRSQFH